jgi:hypothetical protein
MLDKNTANSLILQRRLGRAPQLILRLVGLEAGQRRKQPRCLRKAAILLANQARQFPRLDPDQRLAAAPWDAGDGFSAPGNLTTGTAAYPLGGSSGVSSDEPNDRPDDAQDTSLPPHCKAVGPTSSQLAAE